MTAKLSFALLVILPLFTQAANLEYRVKAVFLFSTAKFVEWPPSAFAGPNAPLVIGVVGDNPFEGVIEEAVFGERINGRTVITKTLAAGDVLDTCHIIFISRSEKERLGMILGKLRHISVLTVSEIDRFAQRGGMIHLAMQDENVRFEVNPQAAEQASLKISSKFLGLAKIVKPERQ